MKEFISKGLITEEQYNSALAYHKKNGVSIADAVIKLGYLSETSVVKYCKKILGY